MNLYLRTSICILVLAWPTYAKVYDVGPGQPYATIGSVHWDALKPGDNVQIHYRVAPYRPMMTLGRNLRRCGVRLQPQL